MLQSACGQINLNGIKPKNLVQQEEEIFTWKATNQMKKSYRICMEDQDIL